MRRKIRAVAWMLVKPDLHAVFGQKCASFALIKSEPTSSGSEQRHWKSYQSNSVSGPWLEILVYFGIVNLAGIRSRVVNWHLSILFSGSLLSQVIERVAWGKLARLGVNHGCWSGCRRCATKWDRLTALMMNVYRAVGSALDSCLIRSLLPWEFHSSIQISGAGMQWYYPWLTGIEIIQLLTSYVSTSCCDFILEST